MPDRAHVTAFLAAALVLAVTPGPGILFGGYKAADRG
jgi:threonine/homoserine/homoserine lactone efflux protein